jgi:hypothetical protein
MWVRGVAYNSERLLLTFNLRIVSADSAFLGSQDLAVLCAIGMEGGSSAKGGKLLALIGDEVLQVVP